MSEMHISLFSPVIAFVAAYADSDGNTDELIIISVKKYTGEYGKYGGTTYEKDDNEGFEYIVNGIVHYLMTNNGFKVAVWSYDDYEAAITMPQRYTHDDLKRMIDSIYER